MKLVAVKPEEFDLFVKANQEAFNYGALEEFGVRDQHFEEEGQIISRETVLESLKTGQAYWIEVKGDKQGGVVVQLEKERGDLDLLFISPQVHSKGLGFQTWTQIEKMYPDIEVWETTTPYFETRNIHFYVNKCGFHIVEFFNHYNPNSQFDDEESRIPFFRFEKRMR